MSLVNDMLRDLEKRGQSGQSPLSDASVRTVSSAVQSRGLRKHLWPLLMVLVALVVGFVLLAWQLWQQRVQTVPPAIAREAQVAQVSVVTAPAPVLPLVINQVSWLPTIDGGELVMRFNDQPEVQLLNQTRQSIVIALPNARLDDMLPLPAVNVISEFNLMIAKDQLLLDLKATGDARFALIREMKNEIRVKVELVKQPMVSPNAIEPIAVQNAVSPPAVKEVSGATSKAPDAAVSEPGSQVANVSAKEVRSAQKIDPVKNRSKPPVQQTEKKIKPVVRPQAVAQNKPVPTPVLRKKAQVLTDEQAVTKARKLLQKSKVSAAQTLLQHQLEVASASPESRALLAGIHLAAGKRAQAEALVDAGLVFAPLDAGLKKVKARVLLARGDSAAAVNLMESAPPAIQKDGEYHEIRAAALQQQGRAEDAVNVYYQLLKYDSRQARLWVGLGYSLELATRVDESRKAYESSLQVPSLDDSLKRFVTQRLEQLAER